ncbi:uroporphyrinogen-III synthase [Halomonas garicola]|uniref:uroporphyrinogen-III synthase n=1 Tax=Halomonas garicola TaxID=1690008 RepID=UPI00289AA1A8|nr:uroporphyrinogen-III synthase [Halomonas garicola]
MQPVLVTRPGERGETLAATLRESGHAVEMLPIMELAPLIETPGQRSIWLDIDQYAKIIVVSPFAAHCLAEALDRYWPQLPLGIDYYSVGSATAEALHARLGVRVRTPPPDAREDTSEALLTLPSLRRLDGEKVLLVAGEGGRLFMTHTLMERGARVTRSEIYRRDYVLPPAASRARLEAGDYRALIVTSGEMLQHLATWCPQGALHQPLIVSSRRLATLAETLGFTATTVASGATPPALTAALARVS